MTAAFPYLTTVDTAAASKDLTVKETVKTEIGETSTTYDTQIDTHIHQESARIVGYCNREFASEKVTDKFRPARARCVEALWLSRVPVGTIHSVVVDGETVDAAEYEVDAPSGELWRLDTSGYRTYWSWSTLIAVQHTSGYTLLTTLPHDVERACIEQVKAQFRSRLRDPTVRSENAPGLGQMAYSVPGGDSFGSSGLTLAVEGMLAPYRHMVVG